MGTLVTFWDWEENLGWKAILWVLSKSTISLYVVQEICGEATGALCLERERFCAQEHGSRKATPCSHFTLLTKEPWELQKSWLTLIWQVTRSFLADHFGIFPPGLLPPLLAGHSSALVLQEAKDWEINADFQSNTLACQSLYIGRYLAPTLHLLHVILPWCSD